MTLPRTYEYQPRTTLMHRRMNQKPDSIILYLVCRMLTTCLLHFSGIASGWHQFVDSEEAQFSYLSWQLKAKAPALLSLHESVDVALRVCSPRRSQKRLDRFNTAQYYSFPWIDGKIKSNYGCRKFFMPLLLAYVYFILEQVTFSIDTNVASSRISIVPTMQKILCFRFDNDFYRLKIPQQRWR